MRLYSYEALLNALKCVCQVLIHLCHVVARWLHDAAHVYRDLEQWLGLRPAQAKSTSGFGHKV